MHRKSHIKTAHRPSDQKLSFLFENGNKNVFEKHKTSPFFILSTHAEQEFSALPKKKFVNEKLNAK